MTDAPMWIIVEDDLELQEVLRAMCRMWGVEPLAFTDGDEAAAWLERVAGGGYDGPIPEAALLDVRLPGESGPNIGARIRAIPRISDIAIILMTAYWMSSGDRRQTIELCQADLMLDKPLPDMDILRQRIEEVIAKRRAAAASASTSPDDGKS